MKRTAGVVPPAALCILAAVGAAPGLQGHPAVAAARSSSTDTCTGPVERPADAETFVAAQGRRASGVGVVVEDA